MKALYIFLPVFFTIDVVLCGLFDGALPLYCSGTILFLTTTIITGRDSAAMIAGGFIFVLLYSLLYGYPPALAGIFFMGSVGILMVLRAMLVRQWFVLSIAIMILLVGIASQTGNFCWTIWNFLTMVGMTIPLVLIMM